MGEPEAREVPHSPRSEAVCIAAAMHNPTYCAQLADTLVPEHFHVEPNAKIWRAALALYARREPVDIATLDVELHDRGEFEQVGGDRYLCDLLDHMPQAANYEHHATVLQRKATARALLKVGTEIATRTGNSTEDHATMLEKAERAVLEITRSQSGTGPLPLGVWLREAREMNMRAQNGDDEGVMTGIPSLDRMTRGLQAEDLVLLAARPSIGKSALAGNVAHHAARLGHRVLLFSLEMGGASIAARLIAAQGSLSLGDIRCGRLSEDGIELLDRAVAELESREEGVRVWIDPTAAITPGALSARARRMHRTHGIGLVIVDYLGLMRVPGKTERREREVAECSAALKALAKELRVPVLALSQLRRPIPGAGKERKPSLTDLRDSGALEQDADVVLLLHRASLSATEAELEVAKHRNGPTGNIKLAWNPSHQRFSELAEVAPRSWMEDRDADRY